MTTTKKVREFIIKNQKASNKEVARACGSTPDFASKERAWLRKEGKIPKAPADYRRKQQHDEQPKPDTTFKQTGDNAEYSFKTNKRILTLDDLVKACDIDLSVWEIERWICNKWEVGRKDKTVDLTWNEKVMDGTMKDKGTIFVEPLFQVKLWLRPKAGPSYHDLKKEIIAEMKKYSPRYPTVKYKKYKEAHLLVIDPADIHLNKLCSAFETGDEYNMEIAEKRIVEGVEGILNKVQGFNIEKILFISGNDKLHIDNPKSTTTSGTFQDSHMMWYDAFRAAVRIEKSVIERLLTVAPLHYQFDPSNHDYMNGFFMAQTIEAWFNRCKEITFDVTIAHRKYFRFGVNLIASTHGDGAKEQDLPLLMAHEAGKDWSECKHRYVYTHHIHHKKSKDYMSVCVESLRSASGTDSWHHRNGYQHAPKAIEGFLHHPQHGQIARITHLF